MSKVLLPMVLVLLLAAAPFAQAAEEMTCLDRSQMIDTLVDQYGEQLAEVRMVENEGLIEMHVSPRSGSWTALLTDEDGVSCVIAVGKGLDPEKIPTIQTGHDV